MAVLSFLKMGNPLLRKVSDPIDFTTEHDFVRTLVADMIETLDTGVKRLGIAAPQVSVLKRVVIFRIPALTHPRYQNSEQHEIPLTILINPSIRPLSTDIQTGFEACISIPGMVGEVDRLNDIEYSYYDSDGNHHTVEAHGFHARVIQHECDHLDGILYPYRMKTLDRFGYEDEMMLHVS